MNNLEISPAAATKITDLLIDERNPKLHLRTYVQGGGCSGLSYGFVFDEDVNDDDFVINCGDVKVLVDAVSMQYLQGAEIGFVDSLAGSVFTVSNPNAVASCGCGNSFAI